MKPAGDTSAIVHVYTDLDKVNSIGMINVKVQQRKDWAKSVTDRLPQHLRNVTNVWLSSPPNLRRSMRRASFILALPKPKKECLRRSPLYMSFCLWNKVMVDLRWSRKELPTRPQLTQHCLDTEWLLSRQQSAFQFYTTIL